MSVMVSKPAPDRSSRRHWSRQSAGVAMRPLSADAVGGACLESGLVAVFSGRFHGFRGRHHRQATPTTNRWGAISRGNHDGTKEKGYVGRAAEDGLIRRQFVEVRPAEAAARNGA